jgi:molecular chaperone DnaK
VPADVKQKIEDGVSRLRQTLNTENAEQIRKDTEALGTDIQAIGASMYQQQPGGPQAGEPGTGEPGAAGPEASGQQGSNGQSGEDVVDGEFRNA